MGMYRTQTFQRPFTNVENSHRWDMNLKEWVKTQATLDKEEYQRKEKLRIEELKIAEAEKLRKTEEEKVATDQKIKEDGLKFMQEMKDTLEKAKLG